MFKIFKIFFILLISFFVLFNLFFYFFEKSIFRVEDLKEKKAVLILGTSRYISNTEGRVNSFYKERIKAANLAYDSGLVEFFVLSGSREGAYYNEPEMMKKDLMALGVPENKIILDYWGDRTWNSVLNMKNIFGVDEFYIISQNFHLKRAIFVSWVNDLKVKGIEAEDPKVLKVYLREFFARMLLLRDLFILFFY